MSRLLFILVTVFLKILSVCFTLDVIISQRTLQFLTLQFTNQRSPFQWASASVHTCVANSPGGWGRLAWGPLKLQRAESVEVKAAFDFWISVCVVCFTQTG